MTSAKLSLDPGRIRNRPKRFGRFRAIGRRAQAHPIPLLFRSCRLRPTVRTFLLPLRRGGITSIAVDILDVNGHGAKSRKVTHELVDLFPKNLRSTHAHGGGPPWRVVAGGE